jgi:hypothetical protein
MVWRLCLVKMVKNNFLVPLIGTFLILILLMNLPAVLAVDTFSGSAGSVANNYQIVGSSSNPQFTQPQFSFGAGINMRDYWSDFDKGDCDKRQDMLLMIPPGGCSPSVVRSDLLEEQNVPVFCKVTSIELNPLIDITKIKSIRFKGEYPKGVQSVSYFPARAAIRSGRTLKASPVEDNIGYLVVVLSSKDYKGVEEDMPDFLEGNVTATIDYDTEGIYGVGSQSFFLDEFSEDDWFRNYRESGFWNGKGYVRATGVEENSAVISIYQDPNTMVASKRLNEGETSDIINLGGYYCAAGMKVKLEDIDYPQDTALIRVDDQEFWVGEGSRFLDGKCRVTKITLDGALGGNVRMSCSGAGSFELKINPPKAVLSLGDGKGREYEQGEFIESVGDRNIYLAYNGRFPGAEENYAVLVALKEGGVVPEGISRFIMDRQLSFDSYGYALRKVKGLAIDLVTMAVGAGFLFKGIKVAKKIRATGRLAKAAKVARVTAVAGSATAGGGLVIAGGTQGIIDLLSNKELEFYDYIASQLKSKYPGLTEDDIKVLPFTNAHWDFDDDDQEDLGDIVLEPLISEATSLDENPLLKQYYDHAINHYMDLSELYPNEKFGENTEAETYAAMGLMNAGDLSRSINLEKESKNYYELLIENYPGTKLADSAENILRTFSAGISKESQALVNMNEDSHFITLFDLKEPTYEDLGAELLFSINTEKGMHTETVRWRKDMEQFIPGTKTAAGITEIEEDSIRLRYVYNRDWTESLAAFGGKYITGENVLPQYVTLQENKQTSITPDISVRVLKINLNKQAKVKLIPEVRGTRTEANFGFKIGIEKRAIQLSPKKTKELIKKIQSQIERWAKINEQLGEIVKGLKTVCFATSAILTVKNFFSGLGGAAQARNELMTAKGGWNEWCRKEASSGNYAGSVDQCLLANNDNINKDVADYEAQIKIRNEEFKEIQKIVGPSDEGLFGDSYNIEDITNKYRDTTFREFYNKNKGIDVYRVPGRDDPVSIDEIVLEENIAQLSIEEMRELVTLGSVSRSRKDSRLGDISAVEGGTILGDVERRLELTAQDEALRAAAKARGLGVSAVEENDLTNKIQSMDTITSTMREYRFLEGSEQAFIHHVPDVETMPQGDGRYEIPPIIRGRKILIGLTRQDGGEYEIKKVVYVDSIPTGDAEAGAVAANTANAAGAVGNAVDIAASLVGGPVNIVNAAVDAVPDDQLTSVVKQYYADRKIATFIKAEAGLYKNEMIEDCVVKYHERAPYKGLPAVVPFDKENGWYVYTEYLVSGFGRPFEDSGRAVNFYVCNVGENGLINRKQSDDICRYYNAASPASTSFPGLSDSKSGKLVSQAQRALQDASKGYGKKRVTIGGRLICEIGIAENAESGKCSDFMSPQECNLMFNVCDPVICPASRCDFGGSYRVDNVIQSGIIGSLLLCLPNYHEGIAVPICLSGVHAGIDGYLSILNSTEMCLQESLDSGRNVGICDEIKSIYLCEFFWKQAVPLIDIVIPRLFEVALGQGARGGGEYMTVQNAYENTQQSIDFFKNEYAVNSFKAFNVRSTEEAGGEVCKAFVGTRYPSSADILDNLVEPDSPEQYAGWFDENVLNTATIPPTSHYKVYYHIYAGKDGGAQYAVYLRGSSDGGLVRSTGDYVVDRGYIAKGSQVDEAKDFIATTGFTELCISVNGQEDCKFKQVSTNAAFNYIRDRAAADQASETDITKSSECVAGKQSLLSVVQPNIQAGVEEAIQPELYKRGIVRVCSTNNPGAQVDKNTGRLDTTRLTVDRWKDVGYCDEPNMRCWVDTDTINDVLAQNKILLNKTLSEIENSYLGDIDFLTVDDSESVLKRARDLIKKGIIEVPVQILTDLEEVESLGSNNNYRANAIFLQAQIYEALTINLYGKILEESEGELSYSTPADSRNLRIVVQWVGDRDNDISWTNYLNTVTYAFDTNLNAWIYKLGPYNGQFSESAISSSSDEVKEYIENPIWFKVSDAQVHVGGSRTLSKINQFYVDHIHAMIVNHLKNDNQINTNAFFNIEKVHDHAEEDDEIMVFNPSDLSKIITVQDDDDGDANNGRVGKLMAAFSKILEGGAESGTHSISRRKTFQDLWNDFKEGKETPFSQFEIGGENTWEDNILNPGNLRIEDVGWIDDEGYLKLKVKEGYEVKLKIYTEEEDWFKENIQMDERHLEYLGSLRDYYDVITVTMVGGDSLELHTEDGDRGFVFEHSDGITKGDGSDNIDNDIIIELLQIENDEEIRFGFKSLAEIPNPFVGVWNGEDLGAVKEGVLGDWEKFKIYPFGVDENSITNIADLSGKEISIKSMNNNKFVSARFDEGESNNPLKAIASAQSEWERFRIVSVIGGFALQSAYNDNYVVVSDEDNFPLQAIGEGSDSDFAKFEIISVGGEGGVRGFARAGDVVDVYANAANIQNIELSYYAILKEVENAAREGRNSEGWIPHNSPEGGLPTIGYGHKVQTPEWTSGLIYGVKFRENGNYVRVSDADIEAIFVKDREKAQALAKTRVNEKLAEKGYNLRWDSLELKYKLAFEELMFNVGSGTFQQWNKVYVELNDGDDRGFVKELRRKATIDGVKGYYDSIDRRVAKVVHSLGFTNSVDEAMGILQG